MLERDAAERFTYDLARIAPTWPSEDERMAEWEAVLAHYLPRLRDYFATRVGDRDIVDEVVSHVVRRALLKLHEIGDAAATWNWMCRTGRNHLADLARRQLVQTKRRAAYEAHLEAVGEDVVPCDLIERVAERHSVAYAGEGTETNADEDDRGLGGRIPIDRGTFESRLAALSPDDRRLLELIEIEGRSHAEAAALLGLASATASRKRHSRACFFVRQGVRAP
jgi:DNA-directed RNA polymerase specialized sigma24 family protein